MFVLSSFGISVLGNQIRLRSFPINLFRNSIAFRLPAIVFEAGQHDAISSYENHVAFIWMILAELRCIRKKNIPDYHKFEETLKKSSPGGSKTFEIKHRHLIQDHEHFKMKDGFVNFQRVEKGETIAHNKNGKIEATRNGLSLIHI